MKSRLLISIVLMLQMLLPSCDKADTTTFDIRTEPSIKGLDATMAIVPKKVGKANVRQIDVTATNNTDSTVTFKLILSAEPHFEASRYLIPGVLYNGNEFVGNTILSDGRAFSTAMPNSWEKDGEPWIFAGDRSSIPACTVSENKDQVFALFASDRDRNSLTGSSSMAKLEDGSFRHMIYWPMTEAPLSYTDKRKFTPRYDQYITLEPGDSFSATAFSCEGRPKWENYGYTVVFPAAWELLEHRADAQRTIAETVRLDRESLRWSRRRNEEGSWFGGGQNDMMFTMGYMNRKTSPDGYTLEEYEKDMTLNRWDNNDVEKSKHLAPGEYIYGAGAKDLGFASQGFQKARVTIEYGLKDGDADEIKFGIEVLSSWIRNRQMPSGLFRRATRPVPGRTFTDASEVGWSIGELSRTAAFLRENRKEIEALGIDASGTADYFEESAAKEVRTILAVLPEGGAIGSQWDFSDGSLKSWAGDCGGYVLMGLVRYWCLTGDKAVKETIDNAFDYYYTRDIDRFECNGGAMDCSSVDREGIQPFLSAAIEMWNATKDRKYLERARKAGWYFLSWVYLQNPTFGPDTDLAIYNWRPAGATIVGTEHAALDEYGDLLISELMQLSKEDNDDMWREVAALMWRNGTQGFADSDRVFWHGMERPEGFKNEAWFPTRWSKYRTGENKRGSLNDHLMNWGGTYRLASLLELSDKDLKWLDEVSRPCTQVILENSHGRALVDLRGANMRCWKKASLGGREILGNLGIPIYWPWAIREGKPGCDIHGLTPYYDWKVKEQTPDSVTLEFDDTDATRRVWPHRFHAEMKYTMGEEMEVEFRVTNTDDHSYACTELLHPFFNVSHPTNCFIEGLSGSKYFWKKEAEMGSDRVWEGLFPISHIAGGNPGIVFESGDGSYTLIDGQNSVTATFRGGIKFIAYVAPEGSVAMETGTVYKDRAYTLEPGQTHTLSLTISAK